MMWEYYVHSCTGQGVPLGKGEDYYQRQQDALNQFGRLGWELVAVTRNVMYFKRPLRAPYDADKIPRHADHLPIVRS